MPVGFPAELQGEGLGAMVHEVVHVVQQYGGGLVSVPLARAPGLARRGIPDSLRFFKV